VFSTELGIRLSFVKTFGFEPPTPPPLGTPLVYFRHWHIYHTEVWAYWVQIIHFSRCSDKHYGFPLQFVFYIILQFFTRSSKWSLSFRFSYKILYTFFLSPIKKEMTLLWWHPPMLDHATKSMTESDFCFKSGFLTSRVYDAALTAAVWMCIRVTVTAFILHGH
jgi:hypothetical protein